MVQPLFNLLAFTFWNKMLNSDGRQYNEPWQYEPLLCQNSNYLESSEKMTETNENLGPDLTITTRTSPLSNFKLLNSEKITVSNENLGLGLGQS